MQEVLFDIEGVTNLLIVPDKLVLTLLLTTIFIYFLFILILTKYIRKLSKKNQNLTNIV